VETRITIPSANRPYTDEQGILTSQSRTFLRAVWVQSLIIGTGSPEGVVEAEIGASYMDDTGTTSNIKYIKRDADDGAGDKSIGWILV
jgi:hypothetical protein